jgi:predicted polyphosphate/ATP-dependent NAD kinase
MSDTDIRRRAAGRARTGFPETKHLGLIVNPVAGIGGRVGLKGSDGVEIQQRALSLGAVPQALDRAVQALARLSDVVGLEITTCPGEMGETVARACGFAPKLVGNVVSGQTTAEDTKAAARQMRDLAVDLLVFAGGDGTARDIYGAIGTNLPVLGIPAGVKIHSAVFANNPISAGELARLYLEGQIDGLREAEVMDIDEDAVRQGRVSAQLYGYLRIPFRAGLVQSLKVPSASEAESLASIAQDVVAKMEEGCLYILGPGTTTRAITDEMGLSKTLIGVDVVLDGELLLADASEAQLLASLRQFRNCPARIVVTPIGGQGFVFGRGNQQISPAVIRAVGKDRIVVVSSPDKLHSLGQQPLRVDTGDPALDEALSGYVVVVTGYNERAVRKVSA